MPFSVVLITTCLFGCGGGSGSAGGVQGGAPSQASGSPGVMLNGDLPGPLPLFPANNWWNLDISSAPVDPNSDAFIHFIGPLRGLHPDFGGDVSTGSVEIYGLPYIVLGDNQPKKAVTFYYADESDGVDQTTGRSFPFYPIPDEAMSQPHWIEGGNPGNVHSAGDRHMIIVDRDNKFLYELFDVFFDGASWQAGSGAFFDMKTNDRRPDGWTSADAAGLAILAGLVRYDEVFGPDEIRPRTATCTRRFIERVRHPVHSPWVRACASSPTETYQALRRKPKKSSGR
jgi:hypothetical protein